MRRCNGPCGHGPCSVPSGRGAARHRARLSSGSVTTNRRGRSEAKSLGGQAQKRGLIPRTPPGDRLLADAAVWLTGEYADAVRSTRQRTLDVRRARARRRPAPGGPAAPVLTANGCRAGHGGWPRRPSPDPATTASSAGSWSASGPRSASTGPTATGRRRSSTGPAVEHGLPRPGSGRSWPAPASRSAAASEACHLGCRRDALHDRAGARHRPRARATRRGSRRPSPTRGSPSTSRRGGRTRPTAATC